MSFLPAGVRYLAASTCTAIYLPIHPSTLPGLSSQDCLSLDAGPISLLLLDFFSLRSDTFFNLPELLSPSTAYLQAQNPFWLTGDAALQLSCAYFGPVPCLGTASRACVQLTVGVAFGPLYLPTPA